MEPLRYPQPRQPVFPPQMSAAVPDMRSRVVNAMAANVFGETPQGRDWSERVLGLAEMTPLGMLTGAYDAGSSLASGNVGNALAAMTAIGAPVARRRGGLPTSQPERFARAREMGFDTSQLWYHGTPSPNFSQFDPAMAGYSQGMALNGRPAIWFTDSPQQASYYAGALARHDPANVGAGGVIPAFIRRGERPPWGDFEGQSMSPQTWYANVENALQTLQSRRGDLPSNVLFKNVPYNWSSTGGPQGMSNVLLVTDPSIIRSPNAAFNPQRISSSNILAGGMGAMAAPYLLGGDQ